MIRRHILIGASTLLMTLGLLPATSASAQDDLRCVEEETRQITEGFHTTVIHACKRWAWHTPTIKDHGTPRPDDDPDGGKGGGTRVEDPPTCASVEDRLAAAREELKLVNQQIPVAEGWVRDATAREATAKQKGYDANRIWRQAADDVDFWFTAYATANGADMEIEVEMRNGVTITRPVTGFRPDVGLEFGWELLYAMNEEATARRARDEAATIYAAVADELLEAHRAYNNLMSRQSALSQLIERLLGQRNNCIE